MVVVFSREPELTQEEVAFEQFLATVLTCVEPHEVPQPVNNWMRELLWDCLRQMPDSLQAQFLVFPNASIEPLAADPEKLVEGLNAQDLILWARFQLLLDRGSERLAAYCAGISPLRSYQKHEFVGDLESLSLGLDRLCGAIKKAGITPAVLTFLPLYSGNCERFVIYTPWDNGTNDWFVGPIVAVHISVDLWS